jgi:hypothetical protein
MTRVAIGGPLAGVATGVPVWGAGQQRSAAGQQHLAMSLPKGGDLGLPLVSMVKVTSSAVSARRGDRLLRAAAESYLTGSGAPASDRHRSGGGHFAAGAATGGPPSGASSNVASRLQSRATTASTAQRPRAPQQRPTLKHVALTQLPSTAFLNLEQIAAQASERSMPGLVSDVLAMTPSAHGTSVLD